MDSEYEDCGLWDVTPCRFEDRIQCTRKTCYPCLKHIHSKAGRGEGRFLRNVGTKVYLWNRAQSSVRSKALTFHFELTRLPFLLYAQRPGPLDSQWSSLNRSQEGFCRWHLHDAVRVGPLTIHPPLAYHVQPGYTVGATELLGKTLSAYN